MIPNKILRGEIWLINLNPVIGHEQANIRPCIIMSNNIFNNCQANLITILPITSKNKNISTHIKILAKESSLLKDSYIICEQIRTISTERLIKKIGPTISSQILKDITDKIKMLLDIY